MVFGPMRDVSCWSRGRELKMISLEEYGLHGAMDGWMKKGDGSYLGWRMNETRRGELNEVEKGLDRWMGG